MLALEFVFGSQPTGFGPSIVGTLRGYEKVHVDPLCGGIVPVRQLETAAGTGFVGRGGPTTVGASPQGQFFCGYYLAFAKTALSTTWNTLRKSRTLPTPSKNSLNTARANIAMLGKKQREPSNGYGDTYNDTAGLASNESNNNDRNNNKHQRQLTNSKDAENIDKDNVLLPTRVCLDFFKLHFQVSIESRSSSSTKSESAKESISSKERPVLPLDPCPLRTSVRCW